MAEKKRKKIISINKSFKKLIAKSINIKPPFEKRFTEKSNNLSSEGVSIITCTNRPMYINNVFENFINQKYENKELIIILNDNSMNIRQWTNKAKKFNESIKIFQIDENKSLGFCLNYGIDKSTYGIIAKFDDDDYYGPKYLSDIIKDFKYADVIGKASTYVYFEESKTLAISNHKRDKCYVYRVQGPTLLFKKEIFNTVKFANKSLGEDAKFCKDCTKSGFKIYSSDIDNYVYIRHGKKDKHAWNISDDLYIDLCKVIGKTDDYKTFADCNSKKTFYHN